MHSYRAYLLDAYEHIIDRIDLTCGEDESARARAREFVGGYAVELWDNARKVTTFEPYRNDVRRADYKSRNKPSPLFT